eukprot:365762-Chlamydomonas_euryale.AAC.2
MQQAQKQVTAGCSRHRSRHQQAPAGSRLQLAASTEAGCSRKTCCRMPPQSTKSTVMGCCLCTGRYTTPIVRDCCSKKLCRIAAAANPLPPPCVPSLPSHAASNTPLKNAASNNPK